MANLPDLDTSVVGLLGFWNSSVSLTQTELTNMMTLLANVTIYDNGFEGQVRMNQYGARDVAGSLLVNVRVRSDGILIAYNLRASDPYLVQTVPAALTLSTLQNIPRSSMFVYASSAGFGSWGDGLKAGSSTMLAETLAVLDTMITNVAKVPVTRANVNHFDYQFSEANHFYLLGDQAGIINAYGLTDTDSFTVLQPNSGNAILALFALYNGRTQSGGNGGAATGFASGQLNATVLFNIGTGNNFTGRGIGYVPTQAAWPLNPIGSVNTVTVVGGVVGATGPATGCCGFGHVVLMIYCTEV